MKASHAGYQEGRCIFRITQESKFHKLGARWRSEVCESCAKLGERDKYFNYPKIFITCTQ